MLRRRCLPALAGIVALSAAAVALTAAVPAAANTAAHHAAASQGSTTCPWVTSTAPIADRVTMLLSQMTLAEKIQEVHGDTADNPGYAGYVPAIPRLCVPALKLEDGPAGVGDGMTGVTQLPAPVSAAASWNTSLTRRYGAVVGAEQWGKGANIDLGPTVNIVRDPRWGRAFEAYGEDPYLAGQMGAADVEGIQGTGTLAQIKHLAVYNQETNRNTSADNAIVDDRTLHEIYLAQFQAAMAQADPASVMCSYSTINGTPACQDGYIQNDVLRGQWGYQGFVTSDWGATHSTVPAALGGLDMQMPDGQYLGAALQTAVQDGQVPMAALDGMVRPILTQMFRFHLFTRAQTGTPASVVTTPAHAAVGKQVAEQGTVLLKNADGVLPLSTSGTHSIAVIGDDGGADAMSVGGGSAGVNATSVVTPFQGISARAGSGVTVRYAQGDPASDGALPAIDPSYFTPSSGTGHGLTGQYYTGMTLSGSPVLTRTDPNVDFNWNSGSPGAGVPADQWSAKWTGTLTAPTTGTYTFSLTSDDGSRLFINGNKVIDNWRDQAANTETAQVTLTAGQAASIEVDYYQDGGSDLVSLGWLPPGVNLQQQAVDLAKRSDVAVVFASNFESEGSDLSGIDLSSTENQLISAVAAANPNTVVVLNTGSAVTMPWLDAVKGVFEAWYPGQDDGDAIAALLFGDVDPSGKLPVTFPKSLSDVPASTAAQWPGVNGQVAYSEGLNVGYRWYEDRGIAPLFAFGSGLSYTSFAFSDLRVDRTRLTSADTVRVSARVTNTGRRAGADVAQLYVGDPASTGEASRQLKGFDRVYLRPGQSATVRFTVPAQDFATWNSALQGWQIADSGYRLLVGDSSVHLPLSAGVTVTRDYGPQGVSLSAPSLLAPGTSGTLTASFQNAADVPVRHVTITPSVPAGWTVSPTRASVGAVAAHGKADVAFTVTAPTNATPGTAQFGASAAFAERVVGGGRVNALPASSAVPFTSFAAAYNTPGVSDNSDPAAGNFDGGGYSYSAQALAAVGITPGSTVTAGSASFTWPNVASGTPDCVTTDGQTIELSGTGGALHLLGAGGFGTQSSPVTITYTDGSTSTGTLTLADWYANAAAPGDTLVATTSDWNIPPGSTLGQHQVSLYATSIPLTAGRTVAYLTLPDNSNLHVFAVSVS